MRRSASGFWLMSLPQLPRQSSLRKGLTTAQLYHRRKKRSPSSRVDFIHLALTSGPCEAALQVNCWLVCSLNVPSSTNKRARSTSSLPEFVRKQVSAHPKAPTHYLEHRINTVGVVYFDPRRLLETHLADKGHIDRTT
jgi:hypothetical protein